MEDLEKLGLHDLRNYAREIGVRAPTSYVKVNLIKEIKRVENGEVKPYYSNRGRPFYKDVILSPDKEIVEKEKELNERIKTFQIITQKFLEKLKTI